MEDLQKGFLIGVFSYFVAELTWLLVSRIFGPTVRHLLGKEEE